MNKPNKACQSPTAFLNDEEREALVFRDLKDAQKAALASDDETTLHSQYPDTRSALERLRAWWHLLRK